MQCGGIDYRIVRKFVFFFLLEKCVVIATSIALEVELGAWCIYESGCGQPLNTCRSVWLDSSWKSPTPQAAVGPLAVP